MRGRVFVELVDGKPVRIFRSAGIAASSQAAKEDRIAEWSRAGAVSAIREEVYKKSNQECRNCGRNLTWNFHMDEILSKGDGGEVSIWNSQALCASCHIGPKGEHGNRRVRWNE